MSFGDATIHGTIHGRQIELDRDSGLPEGQGVTVTLKPDFELPANYAEIVKRLSGAWADEGPELEIFLRACRQEQGDERPDLAP